MVGVRPDQTNHQEVGDCLRSARKQQGLTCEEVAAKANLPLPQILALEEGNFSVFAAEVYAKGAYMRYASLLGIDTKHVQRAMLRAVARSRVTVPLKLHTPQTRWQRMLHPRLLMVCLGLLLAAGVSGYIAWQLQSFWRLPVLAISSPVTNVINDQQAAIQGASEAGARVKINGETVLLNEQEEFRLDVPLRYGINVIRIEAQNAAGRMRVIERHILRPHPAKSST